MTVAARQPDAFELLEQLRAAAEPLGLVVELRPAEQRQPRWDMVRTVAGGEHNRALIVEVLRRESGWMSLKAIAAAVGMPESARKRLDRPVAALLEQGVIEHNGGHTKASRYRLAAAETSTPNDGDGDAEQASADPSTEAAAGFEPAAEAPVDLAREPEMPEAPIRQDLVPRVSRGAESAADRVLRSVAEDGPGTPREIAARLRDAGYARADVTNAVFVLAGATPPQLERTGEQRGGDNVYRRTR